MNGYAMYLRFRILRPSIVSFLADATVFQITMKQRGKSGCMSQALTGR